MSIPKMALARLASQKAPTTPSHGATYTRTVHLSKRGLSANFGPTNYYTTAFDKMTFADSSTDFFLRTASPEMARHLHRTAPATPRATIKRTTHFSAAFFASH